MKKLIVCFAIASLGLLLACGGDKKESASSSSANKNAGSTAEAAVTTGNKKGKLVYKQYCVICHGADGKLAVSGAKDLSVSVLTMEESIDQITNGKGLMTPYKDILSASQIKSVAEYLEELKK